MGLWSRYSTPKPSHITTTTRCGARFAKAGARIRPPTNPMLDARLDARTSRRLGKERNIFDYYRRCRDGSRKPGPEKQPKHPGDLLMLRPRPERSNGLLSKATDCVVIYDSDR